MQRWLIAAGLCALATLLSMAFIDHPLTELVFSKHLSRVVGVLGRIPRLFASTAAIAICAASVFALAPGDASRRAKALARTAASVCAAYVLVSLVLKPAFGRSGPLTWIWNKTDQFYFFGNGGDGDYFFPSSHASLLMATVASLWLLAPSLRLTASAAGLFLCVALVALDIHFLSDVIAGGFIGAGVACLVAKVWPVPDVHRMPGSRPGSAYRRKREP